jgi:hypothetical protein
MSWTIVFLLIGFWVLALANGCSFGGIIHILLVYAGLIGFARFLQTRRPTAASENSQPVVEGLLNSKND